MAEVAKNKKYLTLKDLRVSYRRQDDSIHLSSTDDDMPSGFHLPLTKDTFVETQLRELLQEKGLVDGSAEDFASTSLPQQAFVHDHYFTSPSIAPTFFPLAIGNAGGVELYNPATGKEEHVLGFAVDSQQELLTNSMGKHAGKDLACSPHAMIFGVTGGGKSILLHNIFIGCILRPQEWEVRAIDFKETEFTAYKAYRHVVKTVAHTPSDAAAMLEEIYDENQLRYKEMAEEKVTDFTHLKRKPKRIMLIIDEIGPIFDETVKDEALKYLQAKMYAALSYVGHYGRPAGVHMVLAGQQVPLGLRGELKSDISTRIAAGRVDTNLSSKILGNSEGTKIKANGRLYLRIYGAGNHGQGLFASPDWLEKYMFWHGKHKDGTAVSGPRTQS